MPDHRHGIESRTLHAAAVPPAKVRLLRAIGSVDRTRRDADQAPDRAIV